MADNNLDPEVIRQLATAMEKLTDTSEKAVTENDTALEKAIKNNAKLDRVRDNWIHTLSRSSKESEKKIAADMKGTRAYEDQLKSLGLVKNELGQFQRVTGELTAAQRKRVAEEKAINQKMEAKEDMRNKIAAFQADKTGTILKGIANAGSFVNKTFLDSTKGQSKYGEALDSAGDKLMGLSILFGPFGKAVSFAGAGLLKLAGAALKHNETMNTAYENLSEFGQVDSSGIQQMFDNLQQSGMVVKEMDKFQSVMKESSQGLAFLGDTAAEGQKNISQLYGKTLNTQAERTLKNLGFTNEQALKTYLNYSTNLAKLGVMQGRSQADVLKGSLQYATTLDELTKLTGVQRDELQERQRQAQQDVKFRYALAKATPEMQDSMNAMAMAAAGGGEEFAAGIREMMANGGAAVSDAGVKINLMTNGAASRIIRSFTKGEITFAEANRQIALSAKKVIDPMGQVGTISADAVGQFGITAQTMEYTNLWLSKSSDAEEKIRKDMLDQASGANDAQRKAEVQRQISERNGEQAKDKLNQLVGKGISPAMEALEIVTNALGKAMAKVVKVITFGVVDLTSAYEENKQVTSAVGASVGDPTTRKVLDYIGKVESGGNYNKLVGGKEANLTQMTIAQVMEMQKSMNKAHGFESSAVGKYQVIAGTLKGVMKEAGLSETDKFDEAAQDKIAVALMKRRGYDQYQSGQMDKGTFANNLAKEWASMPTSSGKSAYHGVGTNRSLVSRSEFENVLGGGTTPNIKPMMQMPAAPTTSRVRLPVAETNTTASTPITTPAAAAQNSSTTGKAPGRVDSHGEKLDAMVEHLRQINNNQQELLLHARN